MIPIFCITLRETPERGKRFVDHAVEHGLVDNVRFIYGIPGKDMGIKPAVPFHTDYFITPGHTGLCLSHYMAWAGVESSGAIEALIVEDDVVFCDNFKTKFQELRFRFPHEADIVFLEHCCTEGKKTVDVARGLKSIYYPLCTACYWVNRKALPTLREALKPINSHIDILLEQRALPKLHHYCAVPPLAGQLTQQGLMAGSCC